MSAGRTTNRIARRVAVALIIEKTEEQHIFMVRAVMDTGEVQTLAEGKRTTLSRAVTDGIRSYRKTFAGKGGAV